MKTSKALAVSFDYGQTLAEIDTDLLARRVRERGATASVEALDAGLGRAWDAYNDAIKKGISGHPWKIFMSELLSQGGVPEAVRPQIVDFLWDQQPSFNLWRRAIPDMIELVSELNAQGI